MQAVFQPMAARKLTRPTIVLISRYLITVVLVTRALGEIPSGRMARKTKRPYLVFCGFLAPPVQTTCTHLRQACDKIGDSTRIAEVTTRDPKQRRRSLARQGTTA